jgi:hypothetical protein
MFGPVHPQTVLKPIGAVILGHCDLPNFSLPTNPETIMVYSALFTINPANKGFRNNYLI